MNWCRTVKLTLSGEILWTIGAVTNRWKMVVNIGGCGTEKVTLIIRNRNKLMISRDEDKISPLVKEFTKLPTAPENSRGEPSAALSG
jgi:hypothetical protein